MLKWLVINKKNKRSASEVHQIISYFVYRLILTNKHCLGAHKNNNYTVMQSIIFSLEDDNAMSLIYSPGVDLKSF